jgi:hypothetical protein
MVRVDYDSRTMLSRAQEARVREILAGHVPGTLPAYCLAIERLQRLAKALDVPVTELLG